MKQKLAVVDGERGTACKDESLNLTPDTTLVVFEGPHRLFWSRYNWHFRLEGQWPSQDQRKQVAEFLEANGRVIVIVDPSESWAVPVLIEELPAQTDHLLIRWENSDLADVLVKPLDWLPFPVQVEAFNLLGQLHERQASEKHLLFQPGSKARRANTQDGKVEIICLTPGTSLTEAELLALVETKEAVFAEIAKVA